MRAQQRNDFNPSCDIALLEGTLQNYDWGGLTNIANFEGRKPSGQPEAERWYGTHPSGPAFIGGQELIELIEDNPACTLGPGSSEQDLPFLVKLLDSAQPLSLQAHPDRKQAKAGFAREINEQTPPDCRNYRDPNAKPEVIIALSELWAVAGFRSPVEVANLIRDLRIAELDTELQILESDMPDARKFEHILRDWLTHDTGSRHAALTSACDVYDGSSPVTLAYLHIARQIDNAFPGDVGLLIALLLNCVRLAPGQALYTPPNTLHAYIRGFGLEVMASSDNVLRCAMTSKRRDIAELMRVVDFSPTTPELIDPFSPGGYQAKAFRIEMFRTSTEISHRGPRMLVVTKGNLKIGNNQFDAGDVVWIPHVAGPQRVDTLDAEYALISDPSCAG